VFVRQLGIRCNYSERTQLEDTLTLSQRAQIWDRGYDSVNFIRKERKGIMWQR